ncbi:MAG: aldo/keto reductase, partial [Ilumatobacteraceae bacterium]|nr:aldo/keto reductase [Ilumatobacteraceae bacterium]
MELTDLGRTGVKVSRFGLGTMVLGAWGNTDRAECERIVHRALDAGVNLVDTADVYAFGESEEIVGAAIRGRRDDVVLATKFHNPMGTDPNRRGNSRRWIRMALHDSMRRLGVDHVDLYQVHRPDPATDLEETVDALTDLVRAGDIGYWGTSTFPASDLVELCWVADRRAVARPHTEQPPYSILCRGIEREVLPVCRRHGIGVLTWSPLAGGWLTGKYRRDDLAPAGSRGATNPDHFDGGNPVKLDAVERLAAIAADAGLTLTQLSLAWAASHPAVSSVLLGPRTEAQLDELLTAADV